jgi:fructose-bisphosphate aldolase class II
MESFRSQPAEQRFASGSALKDMPLGAISIAEHVHRVADRYPIYVALNTDHCVKDKLDKFVLRWSTRTELRRAAGRPNLFTAHMFDGSTLPLKENLDIAASLTGAIRENELVLEIEVGAVGGEEDDVKGENGAKLYTTPEDTLAVARKLNTIRRSLRSRRDLWECTWRLQGRVVKLQAEDPEGMSGRLS